MKHSMIQRCIASLLCTIIISGALCPTDVFAADDTKRLKATTATITVNTDIKYQVKENKHLMSKYWYDVDKPDKDSSIVLSYTVNNADFVGVLTSSAGTEYIPGLNLTYKVEDGAPKAFTVSGNGIRIENYENEKHSLGYGCSSAEEDTKSANASEIIWTGDKDSNDSVQLGYVPLFPQTAIDDNSTITKLIFKPMELNTGTLSTESLDKALVDMCGTQGSSSADLSNLNQRMCSALVHYIFSTDATDANPKLSLIKKDNGNISPRWSSVASIDDAAYSELLNNSLSLEHSGSLASYLNKTLGAGATMPSSYTAKYGWQYSTVDAYSPHFIGVLAYEPKSQGISIKNPDNVVALANVQAAYNCLKEYCEFYLETMETIYNTTNWESDETAKASLFYVKKFHDVFGGLIPMIEVLYHKKNPLAGGLSIFDMVMKVEKDLEDMSLETAIDMTTNQYQKHEDKTSPVSLFYTTNAKTGIVSYDRDSVLGDVPVDRSYDEQVKVMKEEQQHDNAVTDKDDYTVENQFLSDSKKQAKVILRLLNYPMSSTEGAIYTNAPEWEDDFKGKTDEEIRDMIVKYYSDHADVFKSNLGLFVRKGIYNDPVKKDKNGDPVVHDTGLNCTELLETLKEYWEERNSSDALIFDFDKDDDIYLFLATPEIIGILNDVIEGDMPVDVEALKTSGDNSREDLKTALDTVVDAGVNENGSASKYSSVTINDFIVQGMGYSVNYIPMQTNLYSVETIKSFQGDDGDNTFYNTYMKLGFLRKALYIDKSASSVQDYYNANGTMTGNTRVATLRDFMELGNKDLALYIDSSVYNADKIQEEGTETLKELNKVNSDAYDAMAAYADMWSQSPNLKANPSAALAIVKDTPLSSLVGACIDESGTTFDYDAFKDAAIEKIKKSYKKDVSIFQTPVELLDYLNSTHESITASQNPSITDSILKTNGFTNYDANVRSILSDVDESAYVNLGKDTELSDSALSYFHIDPEDDTIYTDDNRDSIVFPSSYINKYIAGDAVYTDTTVDEETQTEITNYYTMDSGYTPMMSYAYVSCLYRDARNFALSNAVESNNPVFLASNKLCGVTEANQWYRNTLLNYMLVRNLEGNAQLDVNYVSDLDCPVYMDIFGNIITESGTVVIPAAANATLHCGSYKNYNYAAALYTCYGSEYRVPTDLEGAGTALYPFFLADQNANEYVINGYEVSANGTAIRFDKLDTYNDATRDALKDAYLSYVSSSKTSRLNWMAMVKIANEVMRGAPIESIDKDKEGLATVGVSGSTAGLVAAAKYESLLDSLKGDTANSLLQIPDFSRMDGMEYWVALFIKLLMVATAAVVIISVYRDGVSGQLGIRTFVTSLISIALTVMCVVGLPSIFQLTYYSANRALLQNESLRILMANEEKRQGGEEIGVTKVNTVDSTGEFALQLDWISVPWYEELEQILYSSTLENLQETKLKAYKESPIYENPDVDAYNDGIYITTDSLFDSVVVDYNFTASGDNRGLRLVSNGSNQTASFYTPYYVFLQALTSNINEYNNWQGIAGSTYVSSESAQSHNQSKALNSYNFTTKYMSGNRLKTVGVCKAYFESEQFMKQEKDILRLNQVYCGTKQASNTSSNPEDSEDNWEDIKAQYVQNYQSDNLVQDYLTEQEAVRTRTMTFNNENRLQFRSSYWYNYDLIHADEEYYNEVVAKGADGTENEDETIKLRAAYLDKAIGGYVKRVNAMDEFCRDFVARNRDMLGKVTDETFIKTMALAMSIKYNQLFGVPSANSLEIYNMSSEDLIRLCIVPADEAVMASSMSFPRFVYTFGGEAAVYMAAILSIILWLGSFIKPLCTVVIFVVTFVSIFVFRVVLRKESANLWGYLMTILLLCGTNILHAIILKLGVSLPNFGLPAIACLLFMIVMQVVYLLILAYVTGVSLKDWSNLGANEYAREANLLRRKARKDAEGAMLSGKVKHHENNWDYYNDLVDRHRSRNSQ